MKKKLFINILECPHCEKEITIAYTKKALKKAYKFTTFKADGVVGLTTIIDDEGKIIYCLRGEVRPDARRGVPDPS